MIVGQRIKARLPIIKISQAELARRVGMSQSAMVNLIAGRSRSTTYLHKIARHLQTTSAYLSGEIDDPDEGAPPPQAGPRVQSFLLPVMLPSEDALAAAFQALLEVSRRMDETDLARELAKRLPTLLRVAGDAVAVPPAAEQPARSVAA